MIQSPARTTGVYGPRGLLMCASYARRPTSRTQLLHCRPMSMFAAPSPRQRRRGARRRGLRRDSKSNLPRLNRIRARRASRSPSAIRATRSCPARYACRSRIANKDRAADRRVQQFSTGVCSTAPTSRSPPVSAPIHATDMVIPYWADHRRRSTSRASSRCASTATTVSALRSRSRSLEGHRAVHRVTAAAVRHADRRQPPRRRAVLHADSQAVPVPRRDA